MEELRQAYVDAKQELIQLLNEHSPEMIGEQARPLIDGINKFARAAMTLEDARRKQAAQEKE